MFKLLGCLMSYFPHDFGAVVFRVLVVYCGFAWRVSVFITVNLSCLPLIILLLYGVDWCFGLWVLLPTDAGCGFQ